MSYGTKYLITDASSSKPVPQYYNPTTDSYEPIEGAAGSHYATVFDGTNKLTMNSDGSINARLTGGSLVNTNQLMTTQFNSSGQEVYINGSQGNLDSQGVTNNLIGSAAYQLKFNGSNWDRVRNNVQGPALASATRTATATSSIFTNYDGRGVTAFLNVTAASGTGGLTLQFYGQDPVSGVGFKLNTPPLAVTATGLYVYQTFPGASGSNLTQVTGIALPRTWYIQVSHGDTSSYTYSVGYCVIN